LKHVKLFLKLGAEIHAFRLKREVACRLRTRILLRLFVKKPRFVHLIKLLLATYHTAMALIRFDAITKPDFRW